MDFAQILHQCRESIGPAPRRFSWWSRNFSSSCRFVLPRWLESEDDLILLYRDLPSLTAQGFVTWGQIVQANALLFDDGQTDSPGELIYCTEPDNTMSPDVLGELAVGLGRLKATEPSNHELRAISAHLTAEYTRAFALPVPIKSRTKVALSTTVFHRDHLPAGKITIPFFPIIASTTGSGTVIPLPQTFWPQELRHWHQGASIEAIAAGPATINYKKWIGSLLTWDAPIALLLFLVPALMALFFPQRGVVMECVGVAIPIVGVLARFYHGRKQIRKNYCADGTRMLQLIGLSVGLLLVCLLDAMAILTRGLELGQGDVIASLILGAIYFSLAGFAMYPGKGWD